MAVKLDENHVVVTFQEITAQREAAIQIEKQKILLDNILKHSSNGISVGEMVRDNAGNIVDIRTIIANDAAVKFTGIPKELYLLKTGAELDPSFIGSAYFQMCVKSMETGEPFITQYHFEAIGRWLEVSVSKMDNEHQIYIFTDVTTIKEAQLQLERTVEELRRSNQSLEEFAYAASHDLQEPLRKIQYFSDRLKKGLTTVTPEENSALLERMESSTIRMRTLIDDLLVYSQVSVKQDRLDPVELTDAVEMVLQDLEAIISQTGAVILLDKLPTINGDERQLRQMFQNLIGNAIKYRKPDVVPEVFIRCSIVQTKDPVLNLFAEKPNGKFYLIEVSDNGIGFEQENAEKIFKVFQRLHGRSEYEGTGVGLAIVQKVVSNHNGYISAEGQPGKGSIFRVLLPA
jgi:signal transduction histidine kinase